ncbi:MAG: hypothetical protein JXR37_07175 [Kiritimatiellae bacterium]|nr:hypothetical protein [Kiritimatiellia bacterium]
MGPIGPTRSTWTARTPWSTAGENVALPYQSCVDVDYQLEASGDLAAGAWVPIAGPVPGNDGVNAFSVDTDAPSKFYRLRLAY